MAPLLQYVHLLAAFSSASTALSIGPSLLQVLHTSTASKEMLSESPTAEVQRKRLGFAVGPHTVRQHQVVNMMKHAWKGYTKNCFGEDEVLPVDGGCNNGWHLGLTLIDGLDTLYLMGMTEDFNKARNWVADRDALNFDKGGTVSLFETTIRVLGGLLGAHSLSGDHIFLERARELGDRLLVAFDGVGDVAGKGPPTTDVNLILRQAVSLRDPYVAESTTLSMEFETLAQLTDMPKFAEAVRSVEKAVHKIPKYHGLAHMIESKASYSSFGPFKLGAGGDSYYEYLLKQWLLTGRNDADSLSDYKEAMNGIRRHLVKKTKGPLQLTYIAEMSGHSITKKMDHLVCFLPGTLALGAHYGVNEPWHLDLAKELMRTCYQMYNASGRMLGPEIVMFEEDGKEIKIKDRDSHDLLRPETIESLFYLYRLTGDKKYQEWGWQMAQAIEKYAKVDGGGYASLDSVLATTPTKRNHMESFFAAETLKYLFLLFDDSRQQVPLDKFVFNTEAHPLHIMQV